MYFFEKNDLRRVSTYEKTHCTCSCRFAFLSLLLLLVFFNTFLPLLFEFSMYVIQWWFFWFAILSFITLTSSQLILESRILRFLSTQISAVYFTLLPSNLYFLISSFGFDFIAKFFQNPKTDAFYTQCLQFQALSNILFPFQLITSSFLFWSTCCFRRINPLLFWNTSGTCKSPFLFSGVCCMASSP